MLRALATRLVAAAHEAPAQLGGATREIAFLGGRDRGDPSSHMPHARPQPLLLLMSLVDNGRAAAVARASTVLVAASRCLRGGSPPFKTGAAELIGRLCADREAAAVLLQLRPVAFSDDVLAAAERLAATPHYRAAISTFRNTSQTSRPGSGAAVQEGRGTNMHGAGPPAAGAAVAAQGGAPSRRRGPKRCAKCRKTAAEAGSARLKQCSRCNTVYYCSTACQVGAGGSQRTWGPACHKTVSSCVPAAGPTGCSEASGSCTAQAQVVSFGRAGSGNTVALVRFKLTHASSLYSSCPHVLPCLRNALLCRLRTGRLGTSKLACSSGQRRRDRVACMVHVAVGCHMPP
jgi:hypothetical protein